MGIEVESDWDGVNVVSKLSNTGLITQRLHMLHGSVRVCLLPIVCVCVLLMWAGGSVSSDAHMRFVGSAAFSLQLLRHESKKQMAPSISPRPSRRLGSPLFFFLPHATQRACVCVWGAGIISRSNWDDISALQIELFSSSFHLFSCSFVPHPTTDSLSLWAKNLCS